MSLLVPPVQAQPQVPSLTGRVVDRAALLSPDTERILTDRLAAHEDSTSNQIAVLTVESLQGAPIEDYALEVARTWALGQEEFDNGVLLLIAEQEREMRIEVGYGLEGALPDVVASRIIRYELRPAFREGDFDGGVRAGVSAVVRAIEGEYEPPASSSDGAPSWLTGLFVCVIGALIAGVPGYLLLVTAARQGLGCLLGGLFVIGVVPLAGVFAFLLGLGLLLFGGGMGVVVVILLGFPAVLGVYGWHLVALVRNDRLQALREKAKDGQEITETVQVGWMTLGPGIWAANTLSTGTSTGSSGTSGFGSGGGFSGGGFSGGGGSFGGGGASGGW